MHRPFSPHLGVAFRMLQAAHEIDAALVVEQSLVVDIDSELRPHLPSLATVS